MSNMSQITEPASSRYMGQHRRKSVTMREASPPRSITTGLCPSNQLLNCFLPTNSWRSHSHLRFIMNNDSSKCPEDSNSTDCLLRTLIQLFSDQQKTEDAKFDWDPVTFVFTAIIGIIAVFFAAFAVVPVVQAFLTAGRANRRTSERAIGRWSKKRQRRWNKSEWTFDFAIPVPILRTDFLLSTLFEIERQEKRSGLEKVTDADIPGYYHQAQRTAATWPTFFSKVGLEEFGKLEISNLVRTVDVGFLPDDLVAAPAYAQIKLIILTAAMNPDSHTLLLDGNTGYPVIIGRNFQFEFRQHPLLGLVGAFLPFADICAITFTYGDLWQATWHIHGRLRIRHKGMICASEPDHDNGRRAFKNTRVETFSEEGFSTLKSSVDQAFRLAHSNPRFFLPEDWALSKYQVPLASNFLVMVPDHVPTIFPTSRLGFDLPLIPLALNGKFWTEADVFAIDGVPATSNVECAMQGIPTPDWRRFRWCVDHEDLTKKHRHEDFHGSFDQYQSTEEAASEVPTEGCKAVLYMCLSLLKYPSEKRREFAMYPLDGLYIRQLALSQLRGVDRWLATRYKDRKGRESINTRASCICTTTMLLLEATEAARRGVLGSSMTALESTESAELEWREHTITARESYGDILKSIRQLLDFLNLSNRKHRLSFGKLVSALQKKTEPLNHELLEWFRQEAVHYTDSDLLSLPQDETTFGGDDSLDEDEVLREASRFYENLENVDSQLQALLGLEYRTPEKYINTHRALDRLGEIVVYHSEQEDNWPLWDRYSKGKEDEDGRELDDVIIYRCLLVTLLFRTALDSSEILKSNLWEQVVPIL